MTEGAFLIILQKVTSGEVALPELIGEAAALAASGQARLAQQLYRVWIKFNPDHPQIYVAHFNCSGLDTQLGDLEAAAASLRAALVANPEFMPAHINLGGVLERMGDIHAAVAQWKDALSRPAVINGQAVSYALTAFKQIARVAADHQGQEIAETAVRQCLELNPNQRDVAEQYVALRLAQCKWPVLTPPEGMDRKTLAQNIHPLSVAVYTDDPLYQLASAEQYVRMAVGDAPAENPSDRSRATIDLAGRRLRVGYVSSDLRDHAIGYLMAELFDLHDRDRIEVFAYYCGKPPPVGALSDRIKAAVEHWAEISGMSDDDAAARIAADGIDILVDVNGHTRDARSGVFARRPAPIQVNWLGYPGSMGSPFHHYLIADDWIIPPESELYYSEKVLRLACYQPNDRKRMIAEDRPSRQDAGLPDDALVFCCFNGTHKISRFTFERWLQVLQRTPGSVLWLLETTEDTRLRLRTFAEAHGVEGSRLVFAPKQPNPQHLARYPLADLFLDTVPYGAHTTASDALWMGVPVLTLSGRSFASRVCGSLVRSAGLPELVCESAQDYVEKAVALGNDRPAIAALKARLEEGRYSCVLFDTEALVRRLEGLYGFMCEEHAKGAPRPQLDGVAVYLEEAIQHDHEAVEMFAVEDYPGHYRARMARRHAVRPLRPDGRLWTEDDVVAADAGGPADQTEMPRRRRASGG
jgi:predicted O-linked N-acetylglucosamine transferase (SPINDLY family)